MGRKKILPRGLSFSWKRAIGLTQLKQNFARKTGIPTTMNGFYRKLGRETCKFIGNTVKRMIGLKK